MSWSERKRTEPEGEHAQARRFRRSHPEFQCPIEFRNATPSPSLGPYFFDIPVHLDDGKRPPRPDAINYDACSYRLTEMETNYQFSLPPIDKLFFMTGSFFDFVEDVEDWQPEGDEPCVTNLAPFLVSIDDLKLGEGRVASSAPKIAPLNLPREEKEGPVPLVEHEIAPQVSKRPFDVLPRNISELARAIERTFNANEFVHPYKTGLRIKRITPILPTTSMPPNVAHVVVDQEVREASLVKAMTSPSDPTETFLWLYARGEGRGSEDGKQVYEFQRDFTIQRNIKPDNLLVLYYPKAREGEAQAATITNQFNLRRNRGKASDSLRRVKPKLVVERTPSDSQ
jgi:hypothetical protein